MQEDKKKKKILNGQCQQRLTPPDGGMASIITACGSSVLDARGRDTDVGAFINVLYAT